MGADGGNRLEYHTDHRVEGCLEQLDFTVSVCVCEREREVCLLGSLTCYSSCKSLDPFGGMSTNSVWNCCEHSH